MTERNWQPCTIYLAIPGAPMHRSYRTVHGEKCGADYRTEDGIELDYRELGKTWHYRNPRTPTEDFARYATTKTDEEIRAAMATWDNPAPPQQDYRGSNSAPWGDAVVEVLHGDGTSEDVHIVAGDEVGPFPQSDALDAKAAAMRAAGHLVVSTPEAANDDEPAPAITYGATFEEYRAAPGVNWSTLKHLEASPVHYRHAVDGPPREPTAAMQLGKATHIAVLEPHRWDSEIAVWDGGRRGTNAHKAWVAENEGKLHISEQEAADALAMGEAVRANPHAAKLLASGYAEVMVQWVDKTGIECKGLIDWLCIRGNRVTLVDLKTSRSLDRRAFPAAVARFGYHAQLAHYKAGIAAATGLPVDVFIIAVESAAPYDVGVFELDTGKPDGALYVGEEVRRQLLDSLAECRRLDHWPGRYERVESLVLPSWALIGDDLDDFKFGGE